MMMIRMTCRWPSMGLMTAKMACRWPELDLMMTRMGLFVTEDRLDGQDGFSDWLRMGRVVYSFIFGLTKAGNRGVSEYVKHGPHFDSRILSLHAAIV